MLMECFFKFSSLLYLILLLVLRFCSFSIYYVVFLYYDRFKYIIFCTWKFYSTGTREEKLLKLNILLSSFRLSFASNKRRSSSWCLLFLSFYISPKTATAGPQCFIDLLRFSFSLLRNSCGFCYFHCKITRLISVLKPVFLLCF